MNADVPSHKSAKVNEEKIVTCNMYHLNVKMAPVTVIQISFCVFSVYLKLNAHHLMQTATVKLAQLQLVKL